MSTEIESAWSETKTAPSCSPFVSLKSVLSSVSSVSMEMESVLSPVLSVWAEFILPSFLSVSTKLTLLSTLYGIESKESSLSCFREPQPAVNAVTVTRQTSKEIFV